ncbi:MAG TPA: alpha/beta hydrolase [Acidimicrobiales bacterium]|nr:alpha/beta hydrolase [Acidimicrobiales bacterium]
MRSPPLPPGRHLELPGRGGSFIRELAAPPGGPTLVLLHGWTAASDVTWFRCYQALGQSFGVVAIDQRGHGRGIRSARRFRLDDCADDVAALVELLELGQRGPVIVVGYSMGGCVAQLLWRRHPGTVDGLVLCSTSGIFAETEGERRYFAALGGLGLAARLTPAPLRRQLARRLVERRVVDCDLREWILEELHRNDAIALLQAGHALGRFDSRSWSGQIDVPAAVVVTTADRQVRPARQRTLAASIPGSTLHEVEGGHDSCVSAPERLLPVLIAACSSVAARATRQPAATA